MTMLSRRSALGLAGGAAVAVFPGLDERRTARSRPTRADWRALAASLDGDLLLPDATEFDHVRLLRNPRFDAVQPAAVVRAVRTADVAEAVRFARRFGLPVRPRSGGHSYVGASTVADGLVVDVRRMRSVRYDGASREVGVGAGVSSLRLIRALARDGRAVPTGTCPTVGVVGLALGGGLGIDSRRQGLTCDALTRLTVVTANGTVRRVGPGAPLFWAACGGGGGTVGVVTSMTFRTHPARDMGLFSLTFPWDGAAQAVTGWARYVEGASRSVWCNLELVVGPDGTRGVRVLGRCPPGQQERRAADVERAVRRDATEVWTADKTFLDAVDHLGGPVDPPRAPWVAGSDVVPTITPALAEALAPTVARRAHAGGASRVILDPLTGAVQDRGPRATAFPWRRHAAELQWYAALPAEATVGEVAAAHDWVGHAHGAVSAESVGAYVNRVEPGRPPRDYYAGNLGRLQRIATRLDPTGVFSSPPR